MRPRGIGSFPSDQSGAISPLYAILILVLIALAGVGFDYGRLMAMQSELQNAADQAALAAATQLDGKDDAMVRARNAAIATFATAASEYANETRVANDGEGRTISGLTFRFYDGYEDDAPGNEITSDADGAQANVVQVNVNGREVFYALTPVVGAMSSGQIQANAMAMLKKAVCNLPPLMVCLGKNGFLPPVEPGQAVKLRYGSLAPGAFGFLNISGFDPNSEMGLNRLYSDCKRREVVEVRTGNLGAQSDAMSTRFDMYKNPLACNTSTKDYCPAQGVRKDAAIAVSANVNITSTSPDLTFNQIKQALAASGTNLTCPASFPGNNKPSWTLFENINRLDTSARSLPLDLTYNEGVGEGDWKDRPEAQTYFTRYLPGLSLNDFSTRYEVYQKELTDPARWLVNRDIVGYNFQRDANPKKGVYTHRISGFYCAYPQPVVQPYPVVPSNTQPDRRVLPVAVVDNCDELSGTSRPPHIAAFFNVFLLRPPVSPVDEFDAEVIGPAVDPSTLSGYQFYAKDRAVLIR